MSSPRKRAGLGLAGVAAFSLVLAPASRARAAGLLEGEPGISASSGDAVAAFADLMARLFVLGIVLSENDGPPRRGHDEAAPAALEQDQHAQYDGWDRPSRRRLRDAREGFLFSFGLGGGSMLVSPLGRSGAVQGNLRLGYGFSDRFQFFFDFTGAGANYSYDRSSTSWLMTMRGQTVLIGDRRGNGLNLNLGFGLGGNTKSYGGIDVEHRAGFALAGGLSYDARVSRSFALSPEFFVWWHAVPNDVGRERDVATAMGLQLNFLWYGP